jgi:acetyl-CoA C-acetyltransferase
VSGVAGAPVDLADLDAGTPVVVAAAEVVHRPGEGFEPSSATELMLEAVHAALASTGAADELGPLVGEVLVAHGTWPEPDPGRAVATAVGAPAARSVRNEPGVLQYDLLVRAFEAVSGGDAEVALVAGAENRWSGVVAAKEGRPVPDPPAEATAREPDQVDAPGELPVTPLEIERNLTTAAHQYAIIESALRHAMGHSVEEHRRHLGALWSRFAGIAAQAPAGWDRRRLGPDDITVVSPSNRLIAAPYPKWLVTQWNVDQAVALVVTSVGALRRLGLDAAHVVFPLSLARSNLVVPLQERAELHRWPAAGVVASAALGHAGVAPADVGPVDLYSCFPVAVEVQAAEIGLPLERDLTVTGGMAFGGGPFNSYSLHGVAAVVQRLVEADGPTVGLTTGVSGLLTKPALALWSNRPPTRPYAALDVTERARATTEVRPVDPDLTGRAVVVGATVVPDPADGLQVIAVVESTDGVRTVVLGDDQDLAARVLEEDPVGWEVTIVEPGRLGAG